MNTHRNQRRRVQFQPGAGWAPSAGLEVMETRALLSGLVPHVASVPTVKAQAAVDPWTAYNTGKIRLSTSPVTVVAGSLLTVTVTPDLGESHVTKLTCAYATDEAYVDGKRVTAVKDYSYGQYVYRLVDMPNPAPPQTMTIQNLPAGSHVVQFRIDRTAPDATVKLDQRPPFETFPGPWVCIAVPSGGWSRLVPFNIQANNPLSLNLKATPTASVKPGGTLRYALTCGSSETAKSLVVTDSIPAGTQLVAGSITQGGTLKRGVITWKFTRAPKTSFSFQVKVNKPLRGITQIVDTAKLVGTLSNNMTATKTLTVTTSVKM